VAGIAAIDRYEHKTGLVHAARPGNARAQRLAWLV